MVVVKNDPFVFLARVVVGRLECEDHDQYGNGWAFFVVDTTTCRAGDMNNVFNAGATLMLSPCYRDGWVRW